MLCFFDLSHSKTRSDWFRFTNAARIQERPIFRYPLMSSLPGNNVPIRLTRSLWFNPMVSQAEAILPLLLSHMFRPISLLCLVFHLFSVAVSYLARIREAAQK